LSWLKLVGDQLFAKEAKVSGQKMLLWKLRCQNCKFVKTKREKKNNLT
jgi:hypothetical protein